MTITASSIALTNTISTLREHFGKDIVTRAELIAYMESTGDKIPTKFWNAARVNRGVFSLTLEQISKYDSENVDDETPVETRSTIDTAAMIPLVRDTYVEWGNFKKLNKIVKTSKFFTAYITGGSGTGKNLMIEQVCARNNRPMVRVSITRETKEEHLIGSRTLVDGNIVYEEGPVIWAAKTGAVLVIDEISTADANEIMCLQAVFEGGNFFVKSANELVIPAPGFCIIATDNTKGRGDLTGRYMGTNILNDAFLERFMFTMVQEYPSMKVEKEIYTKLMEKNGVVNEQFISDLVNWSQVIRRAHNEETVDEMITTRRGSHIVNSYLLFGSADDAIDLCTNRFDLTVKKIFMELWDKMKKGEIEIPVESEENSDQ